MKRIRISRCGTQFPSQLTSSRPRVSQCTAVQQRYLQPRNHRPQSTIAADAPESIAPPPQSRRKPSPLESIPSPLTSSALQSAKLAALRSRLSLPTRYPLQTLARTLVHSSADSNPDFNNTSLALLGSNLLGYYTTEHLIANYPRLPMSVLFAAQYAYVGPKSLATIASEWGIEAAAEPGGEVDPGLLQFRRLRSGDSLPDRFTSVKRPQNWNTSTTAKIVYNDEFGDFNAKSEKPELAAQLPVPLEEAAQSFVRALMGGLYLHCGLHSTKRFYNNHFLTRHLDLSTLFDFRTPTRDLSRLCAREGFEAPVARLESETGRVSRHPVFIVGVYSGRDKLGEGAGSSLDEARTRAAANALKSWYLYRPQEVTVPSSTEGGVNGQKWIPNMVDMGEVVS